MMASPNTTAEDVVKLADNALYIVFRCERDVVKEFDFANTRAEAYRIQEDMTGWCGPDGDVTIMSREDA